MAERARAPRKARSKSKKTQSPPARGHNNGPAIGEVPDEVYRRYLPRIEIAAKALEKSEVEPASKERQISRDPESGEGRWLQY
jgi:hypothetical protein